MKNKNLFKVFLGKMTTKALLVFVVFSVIFTFSPVHKTEASFMDSVASAGTTVKNIAVSIYDFFFQKPEVVILETTTTTSPTTIITTTPTVPPPTPSPVIIRNTTTTNTISEDSIIAIVKKILTGEEYYQRNPQSTSGPQGERGSQGATGPEGPRGPQGSPGSTPDLGNYVTYTSYERQVDGLLRSLENSNESISESIATQVSTALLNVSGDSTMGGNLTVSGNITGNILGTINPSFALGSVAFQGSSGLTEDNTNFFWDDTNDRLGIGTTTPTQIFTVEGVGVGQTLALFKKGTSGSTISSTGLVNINTQITDDSSGTNARGLTVWIEPGAGANLARSFRGIEGDAVIPAGDTGVYSNPNSVLGLLFQALYRGSAPGSAAGTTGVYAISGTQTGNGNLASAKGVYSIISASGTGTIASGYGLYVDNPASGGTLTNNYGLYIANQTTGSNNYAVYVDGTTKSYFGGNVGIGTTNPGTGLEVSGVGRQIFINRSTASTGYGQLVFKDSGVENWSIGQRTGDQKFHIYKNLATVGDAMTIDTNGNVGIGITNPATLFDVAGKVRFDPAVADSALANPFLFNTTNTIATHGANVFRVQNNGTDVFRIFSTSGRMDAELVTGGYLSAHGFLGIMGGSTYSISSVQFMDGYNTPVPGVSFHGRDGYGPIDGNISLLGAAGGSSDVDGAHANIRGGSAGSGGSGNHAGGNVYLDGGVKAGSGANGNVLIGTVNPGNVGIGTTNPGAKLEINTGSDVYTASKLLSLKGTNNLYPQTDQLNFSISGSNEFSIQTGYTVKPAGSYTKGADFAPHNLTSDTSHPPYEVSVSSNWPAAGGYRAFDNNIAISWFGQNNGTDWLKLDIGGGNSKILYSYAIAVNTVPEPNRAPRTWTMQGSNNNSTWDVLDTVTNETAWSSGETREYVTDVMTTAYRYFRINITANNGDGTYTQIGELYLYQTNGSTSMPNLVLGAGEAKHLVIANTGNVGIGTTNPGKRLVVDSPGVTTIGTAYGALFTDTVNDGGVLIGSRNYRGNIQGTNAAGNTVKDLLLQGEGGNLGIGGVISPAARAHILSNNSLTINDILFSFGGEGNYRNGISNTLDNGIIENNRMNFLVSDSTVSGQTTVMTLTGGGKVGIGTTNPDYKLDVVGQGRIGRSYVSNTYQKDLSIGFGYENVPKTNLDIMTLDQSGFYNSARFNIPRWHADYTFAREDGTAPGGSTPMMRILSSYQSTASLSLYPSSASISTSGPTITGNPFAVFASSGNSYINAGNVGIGTTNPNSLLSVGALNQFQVTTGGNINWAETVAPSVGILARTSDASTNTLTITGQSAFGSAVTNLNGGGVLIQGGGYTGNSWSTTNGVNLRPSANSNVGLEIRNNGYVGGPLLFAYSSAGVTAPFTISSPVIGLGQGLASGYASELSTNDFENTSFLKIVNDGSNPIRILPGTLRTLIIKSGGGNPAAGGVASQSGQLLTVQGGDAPTSGYSTLPGLAGNGGDALVTGGMGGLSQNGTTRGSGGTVYVVGGGQNVAGSGGSVGNVILAHTGSVVRGNVGIGLTNPSVALDVTGDIEYTGTITDVSDMRLKENISDFTGALSIITNLQAKNYNMIGDDRYEVGFLAQDVNNLFPSATSIIDKERGYLGVSYVSLVPIVSQAVRELNLNLESIATPLDLQDEKSFSDRFFSRITLWMADAGNGIVKIFTDEIETKNLCVSDESGAKTCITKSELDALILGSGSSSGVGVSSEPAPEAPPATEEPADSTPAPVEANPSATETPTVVDESITTEGASVAPEEPASEPAPEGPSTGEAPTSPSTI